MSRPCRCLDQQAQKVRAAGVGLWCCSRGVCSQGLCTSGHGHHRLTATALLVSQLRVTTVKSATAACLEPAMADLMDTGCSSGVGVITEAVRTGCARLRGRLRFRQRSQAGLTSLP